MRIVIAGAGEVGCHSAEVLAADGHEITLLDRHADRIESLAENLDLRTLVGSATHAEVLLEAGVKQADLFVAATDADEINLLAASLAKGIGAAKAIARVHHSAYYDRRGIDYARHLGIDRLVCPEYLTSLAIAGVLRDPAVQAIEHFARGQIIMERIDVSDRAEVIGKPFKSLSLPPGFRIGTVKRQERIVVPTGETILNAGDQITLVGSIATFDKVLRLFRRGERRRRKIVVMGGSAVSVWLSRALDPRTFVIRLFVIDRPRAEELAAKLPHVTVLEADPIAPETFAEENVGEADAFVAATVDDETNILAALQAKHLGVKQTMAAIARSTYHQLIEELGIDRVFSPRIVASREIQRLAHRDVVHKIAQLDEHGAGIYEIDVTRGASTIGRTIAQMQLPQGCVLIAIQRRDDVRVPGPTDRLEIGDTVVAIAHEGLISKLNTLFS